MTNQCAQCSSPLAGDDAFCPKCGTPIAPPKQVNQNPSPEVKSPFCVHCGSAVASDESYCPGCGQPLTEPVSNVADKSSITFTPPILEGKEYHCPECHMVLEAGTNHCTSCGVQFMDPVPEYKMPSWEVERLKEERLRQQEEAALRAVERKRARELQQKNEALARMQVEAREAARMEAVRKAELETQNREAAAQEEAERQRVLSEAQVLRCTHCGHAIKPGSAFCSQCGFTVTPAASTTPPAVGYCLGCGDALSPDDSFCKKCGRLVKAPALSQNQLQQPVYAQAPIPQRPPQVMTPKTVNGTLILILGILGWFIFFCAPLAWFIGSDALKTIDFKGGDPTQRRAVKIGRNLGIIGTVLWIVFFIIKGSSG